MAVLSAVPYCVEMTIISIKVWLYAESFVCVKVCGKANIGDCICLFATSS